MGLSQGAGSALRCSRVSLPDPLLERQVRVLVTLVSVTEKTRCCSEGEMLRMGHHRGAEHTLADLEDSGTCRTVEPLMRI